ncbi:hypothetical protein FB451DRAFT_1452245 [Mycena latifolia]|nr:hypothetical protein FB451DRAFT_1452245 [Mycena latifolia]
MAEGEAERGRGREEGGEGEEGEVDEGGGEEEETGGRCHKGLQLGGGPTTTPAPANCGDGGSSQLCSIYWFRTRIPDPIEQALAHIQSRRYKDFSAELYTVFRVTRIFCADLGLEVDRLEIKAGYAINTIRRQFQYHDNCHGVEFIWCYKYRCDEIKLLEHLVHLSLRTCGAALAPRLCPGCNVWHREFFLDLAAGGIEGLCGIIEFWLGALGQQIESYLERCIAPKIHPTRSLNPGRQRIRKAAMVVTSNQFLRSHRVLAGRAGAADRKLTLNVVLRQRNLSCKAAGNSDDVPWPRSLNLGRWRVRKAARATPSLNLGRQGISTAARALASH